MGTEHAAILEDSASSGAAVEGEASTSPTCTSDFDPTGCAPRDVRLDDESASKVSYHSKSGRLGLSLH